MKPEIWTPRLKSICQNRCGEFGDPPCYEIAPDPCTDCLVESGEEAPLEPIDPNAVIRPLI